MHVLTEGRMCCKCEKPYRATPGMPFICPRCASRSKKPIELLGHVVIGAVVGVILGAIVFFTVPMIAHTWHIITDFWGW